MKTAVVTDSTAYIPEELCQQLNIHITPLNVIFGDESYQEGIDITTDQFYKKIKEVDALPKTSQPSTGYVVETYEKLAKDHDAVISIHLSSGISGTFQGAITAGEMVEGLDVYAYDSELSCMLQGYYVIEAAKMAQAGKHPEEIIKRLDEMKKTMSAYFMADDLSHLQRGGRLNGAQAFVGSLLQVKPVLHFVDKKIVPFEKIRTSKKALKRIYSLFSEVAEKKVPMKAVVFHANREEAAKDIIQQIEQEYPHVDVTISYFGPVIGTHLGEGAMGVGWYEE
ncbi:DegV family protein [Bacillus solimangrovi]|uniref:Fatty acid-binding protein DegV n=1 Tax=Bacillus solimangrovi TaxID=1305675 RepID=A0A1E5LDM5_9BACI|nr:DegV family protein [Bacillus solimangrovi]OEH92193.1 fatty acid-binding protein DegV [Bacillus solimangrovi]